MTDTQKNQIAKLRELGIGYKKIALQLRLSENTVKTYCRRHGFSGNPKQQDVLESSSCLCCGTLVEQTPKRKQKKFCSDNCRNKWWNANLDKVKRKAIYSFQCKTCKKPFTAYGNAKRKYCCFDCYAKRNKGGKV